MDCIYSPWGCREPGWMKYKLESRLAWEMLLTFHTCSWRHPYGRKWRRTKEHLDESEREKWKTWLKIQHSKTKIKASDSITSWQIDEGKVKTVTYFIFLVSKFTVDGGCSCEIKKTPFPWKKSFDKPRQHIKSKDTTLQAKICLVKAIAFLVVMFGCER